MNISPQAEKTSYLKLPNANIEVATLPKEVRYEVETLDRFNQKKLDLLGEIELVTLAIQSQKTKIGDMITKAYAQPAPPSEPEGSHDAANDAEV